MRFLLLIIVICISGCDGELPAPEQATDITEEPKKEVGNEEKKENKVEEPPLVEPTSEPTISTLSEDPSPTIPVAEPENASPLFESLTNQEIQENSTLSFTLQATDLDGDSVSFSCEGCPEESVLDDATGEFSWTPGFEDGGEYELRFTATDSLGAEDSLTVSVKVLNTNRAPVMENLDSLNIAEHSDLNFAVLGSDPDGDELVFSAEDLPPGATFSSNTFTWEDVTPGNYEVTFNVTDGELTSSQGLTINVAQVNEAPTLDSIGPQSVDEGDLISFTVSGTDPEGDTLVFSATGVPSGASFDATSRTFSWTPNGTKSGTYEITFSVSDGEFQDSEVVELVVVEKNLAAPDFGNSAISVVSQDDDQVVITVGLAYDSDGDTITYGLLKEYDCNDVDYGQAFNAGSRRLTVTRTGGFQDGYGSHFFVIYATDNRGGIDYRLIETAYDGGLPWTVQKDDFAPGAYSTDGICGPGTVYDQG